MDFQLLGPVSATHAGHRVALGGRTQRALLALLLLRSGEALTVDHIAETLWPDGSLSDPTNAVQAAVSRLRRTLREARECRIVTCPGAYLLHVPSEQVDLGRFQSLHEQARQAAAQGDVRRCADLLRSALDLGTGSPLGDLALEPYFDREAARVQELRLEAVEDRVEADLALGRHRFVVAELQALVAEHPLRERLWSALILALYRLGRQSDALDAFRHMREDMVARFGIEPGPRLKSLQRAILCQDASLDPGAPPTPPMAGGLTTLIGRDRDVDAVLSLITAREVRLVTLTGAGGIGKTRIAEAVAAAAADRFAGGAVVVEAATAVDDSALALEVAERLGAHSGEEAGITEGVIAHLRNRPMLLVIDNVEQMLPDLRFVTRLLRAVPDLTILLTSRMATRLTGEHELVVEPLELPPPECPADQLELYAASALLLERLRARNPGLSLSDRSAVAIAEICVRLGGVPLSLELAAGCANVLTPEQIAERLDDSLGLLTRGHSDAPARQRTLLATIEWSHRLLEPGHQELLARMSVFSGGCTLEAAEEVCGDDVLNGLSALLDANLLSRVDDPAGGRFEMLEPVREYAGRHLAANPDHEQVCERHARYYARILDGAGGSNRWRDYADIDRVAGELGNARAALRWATGAGRGDLALPLASAFGSLCLVRGHIGEARALLDHAIATCGDAPPRLRASALIGLVGVMLFQDQYREAEAIVREVLAFDASLLDPIDLMYAHNCLGWTAALRGEREVAVAEVETAETWVESCAPDQAAWGRHQAALVLAEAGQLDRSISLLRESHQRFRELGASRANVSCLSNLSVLEIVTGDLPTARRLLNECLALAERHGDASIQSCATSNLAMVEVLDGETEAARRVLLEALARNITLSDRRGAIENVLVAAAIAEQLGRRSHAIELLAAGERLHQEVGAVLSPGELVLSQQLLDPLRQEAGPDELRRARERHAGRDLDGVALLVHAVLTDADVMVSDLSAGGQR